MLLCALAPVKQATHRKSQSSKLNINVPAAGRGVLLEICSFSTHTSMQHRCLVVTAAWTRPGQLQCPSHCQQHHLSRKPALAHSSALRCSSAAQPSYNGDASEPRAAPRQPRNFVQKARNWIFGGPIDKQRLQELGLGAFISYGFVSNVTYGAVFVIGWASHVAATGVRIESRCRLVHAAQCGPLCMHGAGHSVLVPRDQHVPDMHALHTCAAASAV